MNCLIIVQNYPPEIGPVRYSFDLANALQGYGNEIAVITGFPNYPTGKKYPGFDKNIRTIYIENGIEVNRTPVLTASNTQPLRKILGFISFFITALPSLIKKRKVDLIIVSIPSLVVLLHGVLGKLLFGIPFISLLRDLEPYDSILLRGLNKNKFMILLNKISLRLYSLADAIVTVNSSQINTLIQLGLKHRNMTVINRSIAIRNYDNINVQNNYNLRKKVGYIAGLYVGTFGKRHSLPELIGKLISSGISKLSVEFIFIGAGEDSFECKKLINNISNHNVKIYEAIPFEDVPGILNQADFLIYSENLNISPDTIGAKFYEYLASAKPVLAIGNSRAVKKIKELGNGWCLNNLDINNLYLCLNQIISAKHDFNEIGKRGRDYITEYEKNNLFSEKWNKLCHSLIKQQNNFY